MFGWGGGYHNFGGTKRKLEKSRARFNTLKEKIKNKEQEVKEKQAIEESKSWFEKLSVDELKALCKVADLKTSGSKKDLITRLTENPITSEFATNSKLDSVFRFLELKFNKEKVVISATKKQKTSSSSSTSSSLADATDESTLLK